MKNPNMVLLYKIQVRRSQHIGCRKFGSHSPPAHSFCFCVSNIVLRYPDYLA